MAIVSTGRGVAGEVQALRSSACRVRDIYKRGKGRSSPRHMKVLLLYVPRRRRRWCADFSSRQPRRRLPHGARYAAMRACAGGDGVAARRSMPELYMLSACFQERKREGVLAESGREGGGRWQVVRLRRCGCMQCGAQSAPLCSSPPPPQAAELCF